MTWILALVTVLLLGSMAVACYREARSVEPVPNTADRLLAQAGVRLVLSPRQPVPRTQPFRPAPRPGACAR